MSDSSTARTNLEDPRAEAVPSARPTRPSQDWLILGFLALTLALASLVVLLILIAYQKGPSA